MVFGLERKKNQMVSPQNGDTRDRPPPIPRPPPNEATAGKTT